MKCICLILLLFVFVAGSALANDLEEGKIYRFEITVDYLTKPDGSGQYLAARPSKFIVLDASDANNYLIRFVKTYNIGSRENRIVTTVRVDEAYLLPKNHSNTPASSIAILSLSGPVSGPLIVPFKYRLDSKNLTGEATLGYYAGYSVSIPIGNGNRLPITPFLSGGLSIVSDTEDGDNDNKSAFTWSVGLLIQNWANVNIGLLYGEDRTGDQSWEYEGEGWISFMVGWSF